MTLYYEAQVGTKVTHSPPEKIAELVHPETNIESIEPSKLDWPIPLTSR
jgi:hypothetical protein